jgi:hypothetical protein
MSGVYAVRYLLTQNALLTALVPASRIVAGELPLNTGLPAISITQISSVPTNFIQPNSTAKMHTDRVQVSVLCKAPQTRAGTGYSGVKTLLRYVLAACANQRGNVNGVAVDSVVADIAGPDEYDDADMIHHGSRDFVVRFIA